MNSKILTCLLVSFMTWNSSGSAQIECRFEVDRIIPSDGEDGDFFGFSFSLDGDTAIVGANGDDIQNVDEGSGYILVRGATGWEEQAKLIVDDPGPAFGIGRSAAVSGDVAVLGSIVNSSDGDAYVFERSGTTWTQTAKLFPSGADPTFFGYSLAVDGETILVGSRSEKVNGLFTGAVYVYVRNGTTWVEQEQLVPSDGTNSDWFGTMVQLDGDRALVGAVRTDDLGPDSGSVYVFERTGTVWAEVTKLTAPDGMASDYFGANGDLEDDRLVVTSNSNLPVPNAGSVYVYERTGTDWVFQQKLTATDTSYLGYGVNLDGDTIASSAFDDGNGAVIVFRHDGATWVETDKLVYSQGQMTNVADVGMNDDEILVAAWESFTTPGSVYVYMRDSDGGVYCTAKTNSCGTLPSISASGSPSKGPNGNLVLSVQNTKAQKPGLVLYGNSGKAALPFGGGLLCVSPPLQRSVPVVDGQGTPGNCDGLLSINMKEFADGNLGGNPAAFLRIVGQTINTQFWARDTLGNGNLLSDGYQYGVCP